MTYISLITLNTPNNSLKSNLSIILNNPNKSKTHDNPNMPNTHNFPNISDIPNPISLML